MCHNNFKTTRKVKSEEQASKKKSCNREGANGSRINNLQDVFGTVLNGLTIFETNAAAHTQMQQFYKMSTKINFKPNMKERGETYNALSA